MAERPMNYPGNSHKEREAAKEPLPEKPKMQAVTTGVVQKKSLGRRVLETFTGDDMQSVGSYLVFEVLIPAAKNLIMDAASQGVERMLFGESRPRSSSSRTGYTSYNRIATPSRYSREEPREISRTARTTHNYADEVKLPSRAAAIEVLDSLQDLIDKYDHATVADFYDLTGVSPQFTDEKWGWKSIRGANPRLVRGGDYVLDLPRTEPID
jgi:hypothetical protein